MCSCLFITVYCNILTQYITHSNNINQFLNVHWVLRSVGRQESQRKEFVKGFITSTKEVCDLCFVRVTTIQLATLFHMSSEVSASWKPGPKICIQSYSWSLLEFHIWYIYIDFFSIYISYSFFCKVEQKVRGGRERKREKDMMRHTAAVASVIVRKHRHDNRSWNHMGITSSRLCAHKPAGNGNSEVHAEWIPSKHG